jgi:DNA polymerase III alpha subunit (gram-positive type)
MGTVSSSVEYENIKIVDVINEYTVQIEVDDEKDQDVKSIKKLLTVTLKDIEPYDWTVIEQLERSKNARRQLKQLQFSKSQINAIIIEKEGIKECILLDIKNNINLNHWMISMGHVKRKRS